MNKYRKAQRQKHRKDKNIMKLLTWDINNSIIAFTTTRLDGFSKGSYQGLNLAFNVNDDHETVLKNRIKLSEYLHTDLYHMISPTQTHSTNFLEVTKKDGGKGMFSLEDAFYNYDGLYTKDSDVYLISYHADCIPVLIYAEDKQIIGAIHSGWKGTVLQIVDKFIKHLIQKEAVNPDDIYAYIGPSLEQRNFEARDDIINLVKQMSFDTSNFYIKKDKDSYLLDGKGLVQQQLLINGVKKEHITISPYCTIDNNDLFYSYRLNKLCGRNVTAIMRKK